MDNTLQKYLVTDLVTGFYDGWYMRNTDALEAARNWVNRVGHPMSVTGHSVTFRLQRSVLMSYNPPIFNPTGK